MKNNKFLQYGFWIATALLILHISRVYIPYSVEMLAIDRATLREIVPVKTEYAVWVSGSDAASVTFLPETAIAELSWSSADEAIAKVDDSGKITGVGSGVTTLTVTSENGVTSDVSVQVINKVLPPNSDMPPFYYDKLLIANKDNSLGKDYKPELVTVPTSFPAVRVGMQMTPETFDAYTRMYNDCKAATGQGFYLISAYRSYEKQVSLFEEDVAYYQARGYSYDQAVKQTAKSTQYPGHSEHQLGESVDIGNSYSLNYTFYNTVPGARVTANAHKYGFVLRYPSDKTDITGISYEAWHFRYVGVEHATYIFEHDLCIEEYVQLQQEAYAEADRYSQQITASEYLAMMASR